MQVHWLAALMCVLILPLLLLLWAGGLWVFQQTFMAGGGQDLGLRFVLWASAKQSSQVLLAVLMVCAVLGVGLGWLMSQYRFTGKAAFEWLLLAPLAVPSFVSAHAWTQLLAYDAALASGLRASGWVERLPDVRTAAGAGCVLGLALFPYVYTLARVAFASAAQRNRGLRAAATSLGASQKEVFWRVNLPLTLPALAAGLALVGMEALADYGAVAYLGVDTFTVSIYKTWFGADQKNAAIALVTVLLTVVAVLLAVQKKWLGQSRRYQLTLLPQAEPLPALRAGLNVAAFSACALITALGFALPLGSLLWSLASNPDAQLSAPQFARVGQAVWHSIQVASVGAAAVMLLAFCVVAAQFAQAKGRWLNQTVAVAQLGYAVPGAAIAMALLWPIAAIDHAIADALSALTGQKVGLLLVGSMTVLVYAYALRFFAVAYGSVSQAAQRVSSSAFEAALSLGATRKQAIVAVLWPALRPSVAAGFMLAWIDCLKELPATLMLRPFNFDTLPVLAYQWVADERAAQAALPSLILVLVGLAPVWWLRKAQKMC